MVKSKYKSEDISKFLNSWDRKTSKLNLEIKKINLKQKKERSSLRKKEEFTIRLQN